MAVMYIKPSCQNTNCLYHNNPEQVPIKKGKFKRGGKSVQRYQCKNCGETFSTSTLNPRSNFHNPEILKEVFLRYTSGYSVSRLTEELEQDKRTILKAIEFLGEKCRAYHQELLDSGFLSSDKIYFDEMETYIHSKIYPVSLGLAVDVQYKRIIAVGVADIKLKGALKKKVMEDGGGILPPQVADRENHSVPMLNNLMLEIKKSIRPKGSLYSDKKKTYKFLILRHINPNAGISYKPEKSRTKIKESSYPKELGRFSSVCAYLRTHISRMGRRSLITSKKSEMLLHHLYMIVARYNQYELDKILHLENHKEDFFENEWAYRVQKKKERLENEKVFNEKWNKKVALIAVIELLRERYHLPALRSLVRYSKRDRQRGLPNVA